MHRLLFSLACALLLAGSSAAQAQLLPPPKPGGEQPRADITRKAPGGVVSSSGPGTQTEDDIYIGRKVQGNVTPGPASMKPLTPQGPLAAPANPQLVRPVVGQDGGTQGRPYVQFNRTVGPTAGQDGGTQGLLAPGSAAKELNPKAMTPQGPLATPANPQLVRPAMPGGTRGRPSDWCEEDCRKAQGLPDNKPSTFTPKSQPGTESPRTTERR